MRDHKEYLYGIVVGALLVFVPWWISLLCIAAIITYLVLNRDNDKSAQA